MTKTTNMSRPSEFVRLLNGSIATVVVVVVEVPQTVCTSSPEVPRKVISQTGRHQTPQSPTLTKYPSVIPRKRNRSNIFVRGVGSGNEKTPKTPQPSQVLAPLKVRVSCVGLAPFQCNSPRVKTRTIQCSSSLLRRADPVGGWSHDEDANTPGPVVLLFGDLMAVGLSLPASHLFGRH